MIGNWFIWSLVQLLSIITLILELYSATGQTEVDIGSSLSPHAALLVLLSSLTGTVVSPYGLTGSAKGSL